MLKSIAFAWIVPGLLSSFLWSQPVGGQCKKQNIAYYNEAAFDNKKGVKRIYDAYNLAESTDCFPLSDRPADIEIAKKACETERKYIVESAFKEINLSINDLGYWHGFQLIEGSHVDERGLILGVNRAFGVTEQLIKYLNQSPNPKPYISTITVEPSRIGKIHTRLFFDSKLGIKGFVNQQSDGYYEFCKASANCVEVDDYLKDYVVSNGFSLIVDGDKIIDSDIQKLICEDVTADFISSYNKHVARENNPK